MLSYRRTVSKIRFRHESV